MRTNSTAMLLPLVAAVAVWAQRADEQSTDVMQRLEGAPVARDHALDLHDVADRIRQKTNAFRNDHGLRELALDEALTEAASRFADYLATNDVLGHTADGRRPAERAEAKGYSYCIVLENLAYAYRSSGYTAHELVDELVEGWKQSPAHRENLVDPDVAETGIGVARSTDTGAYYAVQLFGLPESSRREITIVNEATTEFEYRLGDRRLRLAPRYTRTHTICRPADLVFLFDESTAFEPADGARYRITGSTGNLRIDTENPVAE